MDYTNEQYAVMKRLHKGVDFSSLSRKEQEIITYLDGQGIAEPRAYIRDGYYVLSQSGEQVLAAHQKEVAEKAARQRMAAEAEAREARQRESDREQQQRQEDKENRRHHENTQLQWDITKYNAKQSAAQQRREHRFQWQLSVFQALLSALAGALLSNLDRIIGWIVSFF